MAQRKQKPTEEIQGDADPATHEAQAQTDREQQLSESLVDFPPREQPTREIGDEAEESARGITKRPFQRPADPFGMHIIHLSPDPKGPKARLLRSNENQAMLLQFSEKPEPDIIAQLKEAGLRWEPRAHSDFAKGAWILNQEPGREWQTHADAERVFQDVVNQIREENGMAAFIPGARQDR
jgi:hypothetical protein